MTRGRSRPPEVVNCHLCVPGERCEKHRIHRPTVCGSCGKTPCRPSCPKFEAPPGPSSTPPERLPGGRPKSPALDVPLAVTLTPAATFYEGPSGAAYRNKAPYSPNTKDFYRRIERLQAIERAATELTRLWEEAPLGTTSAAAVRAAEAELRRVVRST